MERKRIIEFNGRLVTLDSDGLFSVWTKDAQGDVFMYGDTYEYLHDMRPSELFHMLKTNAKRLI
jgi:hypothetical protein